MLRFHPVISIILGLIVFFILRGIAVFLGASSWVGAVLVIPGYSWFGTILIVISSIFGGFIATYFAKDKNMKYGILEGIIINTNIHI